MSRLKYWNDVSQSWEYADYDEDSAESLTPEQIAQIEKNKNDILLLKQSGSGLTQAQIDALDGLFKICAYTTNPAIEYQAFKDAFAGGGILPPQPPITEDSYSITNRLANVKSNNMITSVTKNSSYKATLTADSGYKLDTVTVEMGGINVTESVYLNGVINITNVTGNVVITARSVKVSTLDIPEDGLLVYYDMRDSLGKDNIIKDKSKNNNWVSFYPESGTYENGYITRKMYGGAYPLTNAKERQIATNIHNNATLFVTASNAPQNDKVNPLCKALGRDLVYFQKKVMVYGKDFTAGNESVVVNPLNINTIAWSIDSQNKTKLYINGILKRTYSETAGSANPGWDFFSILDGYSNEYEITTRLHNTALYNKVLTDEEVMQISNTLFENAGGVK